MTDSTGYSAEAPLRQEWDRLEGRLSADLHATLSGIVAEEAAPLADRFYEVLLTDPIGTSFLSHDLVRTHLHGTLQTWLRNLFPGAGLQDFDAMARVQEQTGRVHARIHLPLDLVSRATRLLHGSLLDRVNRSDLSDADRGAVMRVASDTLSIAMELMSQSFVNASNRASRSEEAYRLFSVGQDISQEREAQRAAIAEWLQSILFTVAAGDTGSALPPIRGSEFGMWVTHRASVMFEGLPIIERVMAIMDEIDQRLLPRFAAEASHVPQLLVELQARTGELRTLIVDAFAAVSRLDAGRDSLTRTLNRRFMEAILSREVAMSRQSGHGFCVAMVDLDHFKAVNDAEGHGGGDQVLSQCASVILERSRIGDFVFRYGGEEFLLLLVETDLERAAAIAERIRADIEAAEIVTGDGRRLHITASIGVSQFDGHPDYTRLIETADKALYLAKQAGRNRVELL